MSTIHPMPRPRVKKPHIRRVDGSWGIAAPRVCCWFIGPTPEQAYLKWLTWWARR